MTDFSKTRIQFRRGTAAEFASANPILGSGEPAYAVDTQTFKIGDGATAWDTLAEAGGGVTQEDIDNAISDLINSAPEALDTLNELAAAINDNPNFFSEVAYSGGNVSQFVNDANYLEASVSGVSNSDILVYNSGSGLWINTQISDVVLQGTSNLDIGYQSKASSYGQLAHAAGNFAQDGDAQYSLFVARNNTTDDTANVELFLNGSSERMVIPAESTWTFTINLSAYNDTDNTSAWWIIRGGIRRNAANGTALIGSLITERDYEGAMSGTSAAVTADDTNESLKIAVTGLASKNIRWVAVVDVAQVSWGTP